MKKILLNESERKAVILDREKAIVENFAKIFNKIKRIDEISNEENDISSEINEISPNLFKSAIDVSKERGTDNRTRKLGSLFFNKFIGGDLLGGKIKNITVNAPQQANYTQLTIQVEHTYPNAPVVPDSLKNSFIHYDIYGDIYYDLDNVELDRKDAFTLFKIAQHINPNTRYKEVGKYFNIKGYR